MKAPPHPHHGVAELCTEGSLLYERALREGRLAAGDAGSAPCLLELGLLHPAVDDLDHLEPVAPAVALHRQLHATAARIADERRREERLTALFEPLMRLTGSRTAPTESAALRVLSGNERINQAITEAMDEARQELLCVQPRSGFDSDRAVASLTIALQRDQALLDRGCRIRTLYQHTTRHIQGIIGYHEMLNGDAEARGLDEVTDRLIVVDRAVAFLPANEDGTLALEVRQPALIAYLATAFDRFWRLATPMYPQAVQRPSLNGVTPRQRAIATLLVEGHTDAVIAARLGMNIRTARVHIAKLAATLGSESRAQLGYLIGRSGILDQEEHPEPPHREQRHRDQGPPPRPAPER
ncbi:LuxR C-terminal-related transcriptional regulator [Streptomyces sp. NPDC096132]|uniref:helix-turn-helix transcriptional regulator n=1 Tax=Streptomyces sp. NPDC096132 TaxID=3366075 RepID=UPI00380537CF